MEYEYQNIYDANLVFYSILLFILKFKILFEI